MPELSNLEQSFDEIKNKSRVSTSNPWLDPSFNRIDPWGKEPGMRLEDAPERLGLIQQGQTLDLLGNNFIDLGDTPSDYGKNEQFVRTDGSGSLKFDWPYWVKVGSTIYYKKGNVGVGLSGPTARFHTYGDNILDGAVTINESGRDKDFRVEGATEANLFFCDASLDAIGIGTNAIEGVGGGIKVRVHIVGPDGKLAGATYAHPGVNLIVENDAQAGIQIVSGTDAYILFTDDDSNAPAGQINYDHANSQMDFFVAKGMRMKLSLVGLSVNRADITATNPLTVWQPGTEAGYGTYGGVVARFRADEAKHTAIAIDARSTYDPILAFSTNGLCQWDMRFDNSEDDQFQLRYQGGNGGFDNLVVLEILAAGSVRIPASYLGIMSKNELRFYDDSVNYVGFEAPELTGNQIWVLPAADGAASEVMITDGGGALSWSVALLMPGGENLTDHNLLIGTNAGVSLTAGSGLYNILIGEKAGSSLTTADYNVHIGFEAGYYSDLESYNVFIGALAGRGNGAGQGGTNCVGIGYQTLWRANACQNNVAVGTQALRLVTSGSHNFALGTYALSAITTQARNIAIGAQAGMYYGHTQSTMIGYFAGAGSVDVRLVAIGDSAGRGKTAGGANFSDCTFVGAYSGGNSLCDQVSIYNTGIGAWSLYSINGGDNNVAIGYKAGYHITTGIGNVCIGYMAGETNLTTDSNELWIANSNTATPLIYGEFDNALIKIYDFLFLPNIKSGATQAGAGAAAGELWKTASHATLLDNIVMIGV